MTPDLDPRASDIPTGIKTNGIGLPCIDHFNLIFTLADVWGLAGTSEASNPTPPVVIEGHWRRQPPEQTKIPYAGYDGSDTE